MSVDTSTPLLTAGVDPSRVRIAGAIKQAATTSGASFEYLLTTAKMESNFNPKAAASTSSAHGLYPVHRPDLARHGEGSRLPARLRQICRRHHQIAVGSYSVSDPAARAAIMKLRDDPDAASTMAAVLTQSNSFKLTGLIGRRPTDSELYMAHFMGVGGAAKLISNAEDNPQAVARAAVSERRRGQPLDLLRSTAARARSVSEVYAVLDARYAGAANSQATAHRDGGVGGDIRQRGRARQRRAARRRCRSTTRPISRAFRMHAA